MQVFRSEFLKFRIFETLNFHPCVMLYANFDRIFDGFILRKVLVFGCSECSKFMINKPPDKTA